MGTRGIKMDGQKIKNQKGVALIVALVLLLAISLLGATSLRSGFFHERMSMNSQADTLTFLGAESGINGIMAFAWQIGEGDVDESFFADTILKGTVQNNCITKSAIVAGKCSSASQAFDTRSTGVLFVQAGTTFLGTNGVENSDTTVFSDYKFRTQGTSYFNQTLELPFGTVNQQDWKKLGVGNNPFSMTTSEMTAAAAE